MDPGAGYGRRRSSRVRDPRETRPLGVLLLPRALEEFELRTQASDLLRAPGVLAVEPARVSYEAFLRMPPGISDGLAATQARRLRLPGIPRFVLIFGALQYPLARALIAQHGECELWYAPAAAPPEGPRRRRERFEELHIAAEHRAALRFTVEELLARDGFAPSVWARLESLGIESGRLGSERPDVNPFGLRGL